MNVNYIDHMGTDLTVCNAARVSFDKHHDLLTSGDEKLIGYLAKHDHWTPFSHCTATFRIKAPIFVARQLFKHKVGLTENEISRRYVDSEPEFYIPEVWRGKAKNKKQGSSGILSDNEYIGEAVKSVYERAATMYDLLITKASVAPEQARMVLPQGMFTEWFWTGSMSAWARICKLRISDDAQAESKGIAKMIDKECVKLWPISWSALRGI
jgi:thymidylate synthase (FAD)